MRRGSCLHVAFVAALQRKANLGVVPFKKVGRPAKRYLDQGPSQGAKKPIFGSYRIDDLLVKARCEAQPWCVAMHAAID